MFDLLCVGAGGFVGSAARYLVYKATEILPLSFPLATLFVNGVASFVLGMLLALGVQGLFASERLRLFVVVGVLGGFSTFSAFSGETLDLILNKDFFLAALNVVLNVGLSLCLAAVGFWIANSVGINSNA